jgi:hypothetical protein
MIKRYKFLRLKGKKIRSQSGNLTWKIGEWQTVKQTLSICKVGLHCSKDPYQAFSYVHGEVLAIVECKGDSIVQNDKEVYSHMRIATAYQWTKKDSVAFAIYAAELVIDIYEKKYPGDKRPRQAIEAAKKVLKSDTKKNRNAAYAAAYAAYAADAAADAAAYAAAYAANAAAYAADAAANAAADAAADAAANAALYKKLGVWMIERIKTLKKL